MGLFDNRNIAQAKATGSFQYVTAGGYINVIEAAKEVRSPSTGDEGFVLEMKVLKILDNPDGKANAVGAIVSDYVNASGKAGLMFDGTIKAMMMGILGSTEEEIESDPGAFNKFMETVSSEANPLAGIVVELKAWETITKENQKIFVRKRYLRPIKREEFTELGIEIGQPEAAPTTA